MDFKQIQELIKLIGKSEVGELKIKDGDFQIILRSKDSMGQSAHTGGPAQVAAPATTVQSPPPQSSQPVTEKTGGSKPESTTEGDEGKYTTIKSPMIGTFYRSPSPDKDPFIKVGDVVQKGDVLCIIEAMKLFNEIESEFSGKIIKVLVEDSSPVEYDQPLFLIDNSAA